MLNAILSFTMEMPDSINVTFFNFLIPCVFLAMLYFAKAHIWKRLGLLEK